MDKQGTNARLRRWLHVLVRTVLPVVMGLVLLVLIIVWLAGAFEKKIQPARQELPVVDVASLPTEQVHEVVKEHVEEAVGTLKAASRTVISSRLLAVIEEIGVVAGDEVQQGDVLVRLQDREFRARVEQAEQALRAAVANRQNAEREVARNEKLFQERAVARSILDDTIRQLEVTQAEERRAEQAAEEARVMLSYTIITAPKPGRVVDRLAQPGDTAQPGVPILVLYDAASLRLEAAVPERLVARLRVGDKLMAHVDAQQKDYEATIDEIVPQADAPSRSFLVKATLPPAEGLFEGMFGRLRIPVGMRRHLCLATAAIQRVGQLEYVEVVVDGTLQRRMIQTGQLGMPGRVEVLSGLRAGEEVVLHEAVSGTEKTE